MWYITNNLNVVLAVFEPTVTLNGIPISLRLCQASISGRQKRICGYPPRLFLGVKKGVGISGIIY